MQVIYARISTASQNYERQLKQNVKAYIDVINGDTPFKERPQAQALINNKEVNSIIVEDIDRLGRNASDVLNTLEYFTARGIDIHIEAHGLNTLLPNGKPNPTALLVFAIMGSLAQAEKAKIKEKTQNGIAIAQLKGVYKGRQRGAIKTKESLAKEFKKVIETTNAMLKGGATWAFVCKAMEYPEDLKTINDQGRAVRGKKLNGYASRSTLIKLRKEGLIM